MLGVVDVVVATGSVVVVEGGGSVVEVGGVTVVVVAGGSVVVAAGGLGAVVAGDLRAVVTTPGRVVGLVPSVSVVDGSTAVVEVVEEEVDVVVGTVVVVGRAVVLGDCRATGCRGELSEPVATSNSKPVRASAAMA